MLRLLERLGYGRYDLTRYRYRYRYNIDIDIETKNWYFKFDFINIADNIR